MGELRREVVVPVPAWRRAVSLSGFAVVLILFTSSLDALLWSYTLRRAAEIDARSAAPHPALAARVAPCRALHLTAPELADHAAPRARPELIEVEPVLAPPR